jgi:hypothetical protein
LRDDKDWLLDIIEAIEKICFKYFLGFLNRLASQRPMAFWAVAVPAVHSSDWLQKIIEVAHKSIDQDMPI